VKRISLPPAPAWLDSVADNSQLNVRDVASLLGISKSALMERARLGTFPEGGKNFGFENKTRRIDCGSGHFHTGRRYWIAKDIKGFLKKPTP
jgi:hypothetical protein